MAAVDMYVDMYSEWWRQGTHYPLTKGLHYGNNINFQGCGSIYIPEGKRVRFYENADGTGNISPWYYGPTEFPEFYHVGNTNPGRIAVEDTGLEAKDMVIALHKHDFGSGHIWLKMALPPGEYGIDDYCKNDWIHSIEVPPFTVVTLWDEGNRTGRNVVLTGNDENFPTHYDLAAFNMKDQVSSVKIEPDEWEAAGVRVDQNSIQFDEYDEVASTVELANNGDSDATLKDTVQYTSQTEATQNWEVSAAARFSSETTIKGSFGPFADVEQKFGLEIEVAGGYGQSKSESDGLTFEHGFEVEVPGGEVRYGSLIVKYGRMRGVAEKVYRNRRTGAEVTTKGTFEVSKGVSSRGEIHQ